MNGSRHVIIITDGDEYALRTIEYIATEIGGRCISKSFGNPTKLSGPEIVQYILHAKHDPVFVMFDDSGYIGEGSGETALQYVVNHKKINVLGIIAVAAKTNFTEWTKVDVCIDNTGELTQFGVDKYGVKEWEVGRINGDTVYCLDHLKVPIVVGIGDIGKMAMQDHIKYGSPITRKAVALILERSGFYDNFKKE
ncbi:stage V sporulation protein AE [Bacillus sp. SCS-151]|uniref:stage V sporulation protein AE n=1 Tax=Nanhaiella sioensis TaxID=3115293 RepID=UPI003979978B